MLDDVWDGAFIDVAASIGARVDFVVGMSIAVLTGVIICIVLGVGVFVALMTTSEFTIPASLEEDPLRFC